MYKNVVEAFEEKNPKPGDISYTDETSPPEIYPWHVNAATKFTFAKQNSTSSYGVAGCTFTPLPSGCGSVAMGQVQMIRIEHKEQLEWVFALLRSNGVSAIITAFGDNSLAQQQLFIDHFGFVVVSEYINHHHSGSYKQRMLIRILQ